MAKIIYKPGRVELETPYVQIFLDDLRTIPSRSRIWEPGRRVWIVWEPYVDVAVKMMNAYFPNAEVSGVRDTTREQGRGGRNSQGGNFYDDFFNRDYRGSGSSGNTSGNTSEAPRTGGDHGTLFLTPDAPESVVKAVYKALAVMYHPDKSSDAGATRKMQDVNAAYDRIKKSKGWNK